jgi:phosphonoacetate hydrolase
MLLTQRFIVITLYSLLINRMKKTLVNTPLLLLIIFCLHQTANAQSKAPQKTIIIMMDGFGEDYYRNSDMPNLNQIEKAGIYKVVPSLMPAVTNVNNIAIATGDLPQKNGITGNVFLNPASGKEEYIEDPKLILTPTIFERAKKAGIKSALFSCKKKTVDLMGGVADISLCPECDGAGNTEWAKQFGAPPDVYSKEISYWIFKSALYTIKNNPELGLIYIHTTDYPMHMWPPESADAKDFLHHVDEYIGELRKLVPDAAILITADHGLNHKDLCWDLDKACLNRKTPIKIAVSPEKDKYVKHHRGMGGAAYVYLNDKKDLEKVRKTILSLKGIDAVITKAEAVKKYGLMPERIGDLMVLGDKTTVFGNLESAESEKLDEHYRSHGSAYEAHVPLFVYNARNAPGAAYFKSNYLLASWLYR